MKKKQTSAQRPSTSTVLDLKSLIRDHSLFFDKLIELIPAKFYLPSDEDKPWFQGLNKSAKEAAKKQTRENIKKARRDRLDPGKSQTSTLELLKQSIETEKQACKSEPHSDGDEEDDVNPVSNVESVTYEELRKRRRRKMEELRGNRGTGKRSKRERSRDKKDDHQKKRKRDGDEEEKSLRDGKGSDTGKSWSEIEKDVTEATKGIEFGKVKLVSEEESGGKKKRKLSKAKELERAKRLEEAKKDPEKGELLAKKHSWNAAVSRAAGVKVHDDPKLLKQSMQKEKKRHEKNVDKWKDRVDTREKMKGEKQQKRAGNIADRIQQKKMRKIAKREKKLMRPGFEGRKEGYITKD